MQVPDEFKKLTRCFWQGSHLEAATSEEWIKNALKLCSVEERAVAKEFLTNLLDGSATTEDLQFAWGCGGTTYGLPDSGIREFLVEMRRVLNEEQR